MAERLRIVLELDDKGFSKAVVKNNKLIKRFGQNLNTLDKGIVKNERHVDSWGRKLRNVTVTLASLNYLVPNLTNVMFGWQRGIVNANADLEQSIAIMRNFSTEVSNTAAEVEARNFVESIVDKAAQAPFSIDALTDSMVKLRVSGVDNVNKSFDALVDSVAAFGGTDTTLKRASVAIQQMGGKGVISMEELRQQLGEAVPNAISLMARSLNTTYGELVKEISTGNVQSQPALSAMFEEMERSLGGSALRMMDTFNGLMAQIRTEATKAAREIGEAGYFDALKDQMYELVQLMQSQDFARFMADIGKGLAEAMSWLQEFFSFIKENISTIKAFTEVLIGMYAIRKLTPIFSKLKDSMGATLATMGKQRDKVIELNDSYDRLGRNTEYRTKLQDRYIAKQRAANQHYAANVDLSKIDIKNKDALNRRTNEMVQLVKKHNFEMGRRAKMTTAVTKAERTMAIEWAKRGVLLQELNSGLAVQADRFARSTIRAKKMNLALKALGVMVNSLKIAFAAFAPFVLPIVAGLALQWHENKKAVQENIDKLIEYQGAYATVEQMAAARNQLKQLKQENADTQALEDARRRLTKATLALQKAEKDGPGPSGFGSIGLVKFQKDVELAQKELDRLESLPERIAELERVIAKGQQDLGHSMADSLINRLKRGFSVSDVLTEAQRLYNNTQKEIAKAMTDKDNPMSQEEAQKRRTESIVKYEKTRLAEYKKALTEQQEIMAKLRNGNAKPEEMIRTEKTIRFLGEEISKIMGTLNDPNSATLPDVLGVGQGSKQEAFDMMMGMTKLKNKINQVKGDLAEIESSGSSTGGLFEKFKASLGKVAEGEEAQKLLAELKTLMVELTEVELKETQAENLEKMSEKVNVFIATTRKAGEEARAAFAEPVNGLSLSSTAVDKYDGKMDALILKINKLAEAGELTTKSAAEMIRTLADGRATAQLTDMATLYAQVSAKSEQAQTKINRQRNVEENTYQSQIADLQQMLAGLDKKAEGYENVAGAVNKYIARLKTLSDLEKGESGNIFQKWLDDTKGLNESFQDLTATGMDGLVDVFTNGLTGASGSFSEFAESIIKDLTRMMTKMLLYKAIAGTLGMFNSPAAKGGAVTGGFEMPVATSAKGNVVGSFGVRNLQMKKYASGGVANSPQLSIFGEGSMPEAYVPLPDGRTIPVTVEGGMGRQGPSKVEVNVFNQGGQRMEGESSSRFDGEKMIVDVMLKQINKPGPVRQSIKGVR